MPSKGVKSFANRPFAWRTVVSAVKGQPKKCVVRECLVLSMKELFDKCLIADRAFHIGSWRWADADIFQLTGAMRYEADLRNHETASLRLQYELDSLEIDYRVLLSSEEQGLLGPRWWFRCPLGDIRVTKLYLPPGARRFASRQAHELTYPLSRRGSSAPKARLIPLEVTVVAS
jgi:hypothetical protein